MNAARRGLQGFSPADGHALLGAYGAISVDNSPEDRRLSPLSTWLQTPG